MKVPYLKNLASGHPLAADFHIAVHQRPEQIETSWKTIQETGHSTVFQRFDWSRNWYEKIAPAKSLEPCIVEVRSLRHKAPVLVLPLCVEQKNGMRIVTFADGGISDYNAPLVGSAFEADAPAFRALWEGIKTALPEADVLFMEKMPERVGGISNPMLLLEGNQMASLKSFGVKLGVPFDEWKAQTLAPKFHQDMVAKTRKMGKAAKVRFVVPETEHEADAIFAALREQRAERFAALGRDEVLDDEPVRNFYRTIVSPTGNLGGTLFALYGDDDIAATGLALVDRSAVHMLMISHKTTRWRNYSPGMQLFLGAMKWAAERGIPFFDFTTGGETYKVSFGTTSSDLFQRSEGLSMRGALSAGRARLERRIKNLATDLGLKKYLGR